MELGFCLFFRFSCRTCAASVLVWLVRTAGKGGLFFGRPCGKGAFVMRKAICVMLSLVLLLALAVPAFATDNQDLTLEEKQALYAKYEEMVAAANEEHGLEISVLPFDELETFYSEEEFAQMLAEFCGILLAPPVRVGGAAPTGAIRGAGTTTVPYSTTQVHGNTTVSITIFGTFNVSAWPDGTYYIRSMAFDAIASSSSSYLYYVKDGDGRVTGYADGGRTLIVTQDFDIYTYNVFSTSTSVNAYFYFDDNTGEIIAL